MWFSCLIYFLSLLSINYYFFLFSLHHTTISHLCIFLLFFYHVQFDVFCFLALCLLSFIIYFLLLFLILPSSHDDFPLLHLIIFSSGYLLQFTIFVRLVYGRFSCLVFTLIDYLFLYFLILPSSHDDFPLLHHFISYFLLSCNLMSFVCIVLRWFSCLFFSFPSFFSLNVFRSFHSLFSFFIFFRHLSTLTRNCEVLDRGSVFFVVASTLSFFSFF